jgi:hypothetical protein
MRSTKLTIALVAATLLTPLAAESATAATARVVVVTHGLPSALSLNTLGCGQLDDNVEYVHVPGPAKAPTGKGSLEFEGPGTTDVSLTAARPASQLTALSMYAYSVHGTDPNFIIRLTLNSNGSTADVLDLVGGPDAHWTNLNPLTATLELSHEDLSSHQLTDVGPMTFAAYQTANPGSTLNGVDLVNTNCSPSGVAILALDDVTLGFSGHTPTTYNFEPDTTLSVSINAPSKIAKGGEATVRGFIARRNVVLEGISIELQASAKGTHGWIDADDLGSVWNGAVHSEQYLNTTTKFRFVVAGSDEVGPVTSKVVTVRVVPPPKKHKKKRR